MEPKNRIPRRVTTANTVVLVLMGLCLQAVGAEIVVPARNHAAKSKNIVSADRNWDGLVVSYGTGGMQEWHVKIPKAGRYYFHVYYASGERRPVRLFINDEQQKGLFIDRSTGGFFKPDLSWQTHGPFALRKGQNKIRINAVGSSPHLAGWVISDNGKAWNKQAFAKLFPGGGTVLGQKTAMTAEQAAAALAALAKKAARLDFDKIVFVKRYTYNSNHYYTEFINSKWMPGGNLCILDLKTGQVKELVPELKGGVFERFDLSFDAKKIIFAWKSAWQEGYRIYEIGIVPATGARTGKLRQLTFPPENEKELQRLYRARPHYHHGTDDMQPCYLPDGGIAFISTRCQFGILCDGPDDFTTTVLYRMGANGKNMCRLSNSSVSEASPAVLPDGRIMYTRWEYVDKGSVSAKCLWAMHPDGSGSVEIYANDISLPPTFIYGRAIPNAPRKYVVLGTPHCPQNGMGTVIRLDMGRNIRTREPMTYMTPYVDVRAEGGFSFRDGNGRWRGDRGGRGPLFKDPYPLSQKLFLVSHKPAGPVWTDPKAYGLYLLGEKGNTHLIYRDPEISCWMPLPLRPREKPPVLNSSLDPKMAAKGLATCVVTDIYRGLEGVERGSIKYIRINEQVPRPWSARRRWGGDTYDQQHACVSKATHLGLKVQYGIVPVEEDGSAHFVVPAMKNIFFQALDENYMEVQRERTYVNYMPGETRSCIGCHETQVDVTASSRKGVAAALRRPPSGPGPQPGEKTGSRPLDYPTDVQPVLDKRCIKCHSGKEPKGKPLGPPGGLDLSGTMTSVFSRSYENLLRRRVMKLIGENHPKTGNVHYLPAKRLGSHASVLVAMFSKGKVKLKDRKQAEHAARLAQVHKDVNLSKEEMIRVITWVDSNAQYYGSYYGRKNIKHKGHPNFRPVPTFESAIGIRPIKDEKDR